ncbi:MAG: hypothetical protein KGJ70_11400, partial [Gemmatimonadota bacterium]|nr:hypothetical protein [Gemmatimonadota bacterium]
MTTFGSTAALRATMDAYFRDVGAAAEQHLAPVAWCTSVGPAELLRALGFRVFFPENHAAMMGAARTANRYMPLAHAHGYSQEICSYLTSDIGAYLAGESPMQAYGLSGTPRADVLLRGGADVAEVGVHGRLERGGGPEGRHDTSPCR